MTRSASARRWSLGRRIDVAVELEATTWRFARGHKLRLSVAGADWPNTAAPPEPVVLHVQAGRLELPVMEEPSPWPTPEFVAGDDHPEESSDGVVWRVERDVLARTTACVVESLSEYDAPYGSVVEHYSGRVSVDARTFEQRAESDVSLTSAIPRPGCPRWCRGRPSTSVGPRRPTTWRSSWSASRVMRRSRAAGGSAASPAPAERTVQRVR